MNIENVIVFGAGAAGSNLFLHLLHTHVGLNYTLVDFDVVEHRNIEPGTQPYIRADLHRPKVQALQRMAMMLKKKRVDILNERVETVERLRQIIRVPETTLVVDAFDNAPSRNLFTTLNNRHHVMHVGFSAMMTGSVLWDNSFSRMDESPADTAIDVCEMSLARPFIHSLCALATVLATKFLEKGEKTNMYFDTTPFIKHWEAGS